MPPLDTSKSNSALSYDASDILDENDKSLFLHKRPLLNAETMVKKGHYKSALEIYYRALGKIANVEVQRKLQENITDLHGLLKNTDPDSEKTFIEKYSDTRGKEFSKSLKQFTENLSDSLTEKLNILKQIDTIPERGQGNPAFADRAPVNEKGDQSELKPLDLGSLDAKGKQATNEPETKNEISSSPKDDVSNVFSEKTEIDTDTAPIRSEKTELKSESTDIDAKSAVIENENAELKSESSEIHNESAEFKNETNIQNATLDSTSLQIDPEKLKTISPLESDAITKATKSIEQGGDLELSAEFSESESRDVDKEGITEYRKVEETRIVKEYKETIDSPRKENESFLESNFPESEKPLSKKEKTAIEQTEEILFSKKSKTVDVETGWSELEKEGPKPKADKDYAPVMEKYEAGSIEIPESTEFYTVDFNSAEDESQNIKTDSSERSKEAQSDRTDPKKLNQGGIFPKQGMTPGIPTGFSEAEDSDKQSFSVPPLPPPLPLNINDWLSNLYFSKEWEKFKPLPMKERRSGKERRVNNSKQLPKGIKKERRSGFERRNQNTNLLPEREEFLNNLHKNNQGLPQKPFKPISEHFPSLEEMGFPTPENFSDALKDPSLRTLEFLPRDPTAKGSLPTSDELVKVELPDPEEISLKPQLDQNEIQKESVSNEISEQLPPQRSANEELGLIESDKGLVKIQLPDPILLKSEDNELPHREVSGEIEVSSKDGTGITGEAEKGKDTSSMGPYPYTPEAYAIPDELKIELPDPDDFLRTKSGHLIDPFALEETPDINMIDGDGPLDDNGAEISGIPELPPPPPEPERTIHGILELKPPEIDDAPFLTLTYDFSKIPHPFKLSKNYSIMEYSYYKYKPMLMKAQEFARRKMLKNALNYYRVIKSQNIPPELKDMINRNITDITEFLEKFIMSKGGG